MECHETGHVRVVHYNGSDWNQLGADIDGEAAGDCSGYSVAMSADGLTVAVGAPYSTAMVLGTSGWFDWTMVLLGFRSASSMEMLLMQSIGLVGGYLRGWLHNCDWSHWSQF